MSGKDKFKDELRNNNFVEALKTALSEAIELEIITWVVPADQGDLGQDTPENALPGHLMRTRINLVDGDIHNEIGSHFVGSGPYTELRQFHLEQVQKGQDTVQKNLTNLKQLFEILVEKIHGLPRTEHLLASKSGGSSWPSPAQEVALSAADEEISDEEDGEMFKQADSTLFSGNPETVDSPTDDEVSNSQT